MSPVTARSITGYANPHGRRSGLRAGGGRPTPALLDEVVNALAPG